MTLGRRVFLIAVAALALGCDGTQATGSKPPARTGPLAITDEPSQGVSASLGGQGLLVIDDECVTLQMQEPRRQITLAFRSTQIRWDPSLNQATFLDPFLGSVVLSNGELIEVGGEAVGASTGGEPPNTRRWIAPPNSSCPSDVFEVHTLTFKTRGPVSAQHPSTVAQHLVA